MIGRGKEPCLAYSRMPRVEGNSVERVLELENHFCSCHKSRLDHTTIINLCYSSGTAFWQIKSIASATELYVQRMSHPRHTSEISSFSNLIFRIYSP